MAETQGPHSIPSIESLKTEYGADLKIHSVVPAIEVLLRAADQGHEHGPQLGACCANCVSNPEWCGGDGYSR
jgi:hypothetical protein